MKSLALKVKMMNFFCPQWSQVHLKNRCCLLICMSTKDRFLEEWSLFKCQMCQSNAAIMHFVALTG